MSGSISSTTVAIISTVVAAGSAAYSGYRQAEMADYQAEVAEQQAIAEKNKAAYEEQAHRERVRKILGAQRAAYGASGVDATGSPLLVMEDTVREGEMDAMAIRYGGEVKSARARSEAALAKMQGKAAAASSYAQAGSSLLSGGYKAYKG